MYTSQCFEAEQRAGKSTKMRPSLRRLRRGQNRHSCHRSNARRCQVLIMPKVSIAGVWTEELLPNVELYHDARMLKPF